MSTPPAEPSSAKERLAAATEAQDWQEVQRLAKELEREKLKAELQRAIESDDFEAVQRLGRALEGGKAGGGEPEPEPQPEPEPEPEVFKQPHDWDGGAAALYASQPNDGARRAYQQWEARVSAPDGGDPAGDDEGPEESMRMEELHFLDEPALQPPTLALATAGGEGEGEGRTVGLRLRWQLIGAHRHAPSRQVEMTTDRFRIAYRHAAWWTWQYKDVVLGQTPDCLRLAEAADGSCEYLLPLAAEGTAAQPGTCAPTPTPQPAPLPAERPPLQSSAQIKCAWRRCTSSCTSGRCVSGRRRWRSRCRSALALRRGPGAPCSSKYTLC